MRKRPPVIEPLDNLFPNVNKVVSLFGFNKLLEEVDVSLRRDEVEEPLAKEQNESNNLDTAGIGKRVRGIKVKERTCIKTSKRPKNALERATKKNKSQGQPCGRGRPPSDDLDFMREPVTRSELPSSPLFFQKLSNTTHASLKAKAFLQLADTRRVIVLYPENKHPCQAAVPYSAISDPKLLVLWNLLSLEVMDMDNVSLGVEYGQPVYSEAPCSDTSFSPQVAPVSAGYCGS
ncbi:hypothetical protein RHGRI_016178 [Rhododendron griersonianum]|uniref:Uncharacterized protein n=1 Tax=Rhododendron griersonianum TaxID=479676 RepID=A0AAV6JSM1_9ERIC|nr:hypothetical protein RHGRI_016178 [Rhododendron griersonianum]